MAEISQTLQRCSRCNCTILLKFFKINRKGLHLKTCTPCRVKKKASVERHKCEHKRQRSHCKECKGAGICKHNKVRSSCKECLGGSICEHKNYRVKCKECGGSQICSHNKLRYRCKICGGASYCIHDTRREYCKICDGSQICIHKKHRFTCKICDPNGHLAHIVKGRIKNALNHNKNKKSLEYLGCTIKEFRKHISDQFKDNMTWENYGEWQIDHIIPLKYQSPTIEQTIERLHYTNTQPMWAAENMAKGNRYIG